MKVSSFKVAESQKNRDASRSSDVQLGQHSFIKGCIIAVIWFSLSRNLNRGQLNLDHFKFWLPTSQLLVLDVCLFDAFA
ncbi:DUF645 family protein [Vibrio cholerae]|nr:DUF645 family protein [Vibrio cholerae]EJL6375339.1 DUF645 family protein [Vibrio cholerae]EKF9103674.1 DUF645 family protein [Vibrio cholerae]ELJ8498398.1 DUF645 family protein [Vibrio cholerae]EMC9265792.1 DUF645 family protein [Vibrio cholerae]